MKLLVPQVIDTFFQATNNYDSSLILTAFSEEATLYDEGKTFHGPIEIEKHIVKANNNLQVKTTVKTFIEKNEQIIVTATISGNFNGSPVDLDYYFTLADEKIRSLKIKSAEQ